MLLGAAVLPIIVLVIVALLPLISLFSGVIRKVILLSPELSPLFIPFTVNLILPSDQHRSGTFTVLNEVKSAPPSLSSNIINRG